MKLWSNFAAGVAHSLVTAIVGVAVVPFYIRYLGIEAYGLIGFSLTLQGVLQLLDLGLSPAISREVARGLATDEMGRPRNLLHSLAGIYWVTALLIGAGFVLSARPIATLWLNGSAIDTATLANAVLMIGLLIACRWPSGLYSGALTGAHRLMVASALGIAYVMVSNIGAVLVLAFWSATIEAYFLWHTVSALAYTLAIRTATWRIIGGRPTAAFDTPALKSIGRFALGMSGVAATAAVFTQLDKVILSKLVSLAEFAHYMLATVAAGLLYALVRPMFNVMYPRLSTLVAAGEVGQLENFYRAASGLFTLLWFPVAMAFALCAHPLVLLWAGDAQIAARTAPLLSLLAIGNALHAVMYFPYALQLAYGLSRLPLLINCILMIFQLPLIIFLATRYGAVGAALAWIILHSCYIMLGTWLTHRRLLPEVGLPWLVRDVAVPMGVSSALGVTAAHILSRTDLSIPLHIAGAVCAALLALLISAAVSPYRPSDFRAVLRG